jgi:hypothetical protein
MTDNAVIDIKEFRFRKAREECNHAGQAFFAAVGEKDLTPMQAVVAAVSVLGAIYAYVWEEHPTEAAAIRAAIEDGVPIFLNDVESEVPLGGAT